MAVAIAPCEQPFTKIDCVDQIMRYIVINVDETSVTLWFTDIRRGCM